MVELWTYFGKVFFEVGQIFIVVVYWSILKPFGHTRQIVNDCKRNRLLLINEDIHQNFVFPSKEAALNVFLIRI